MTNTTHNHRPTVYESAIDRWVACLLMLSPIASIVVGIWMWTQGQSDNAFIMFIAGAVTTLVTVACCLPCRYTILDDALSIRCGVMLSQVPLNSIKKVEPSATLRNGPALSLRRVVVGTDKKDHVLSPKQRDEFINDLSAAIVQLQENVNSETPEQ